MIKIIIAAFCCFIFSTAGAQQTITVKISEPGGEPIPATVTVNNTNIITAANSAGIATVSLPANGSYRLTVTATDFQPGILEVTVPYNGDTVLVVLTKEEEEMEEVVIKSTRSGRTISNVPTRVETIDLEEIEEKSNMRPANVAMILHESTGIQVQQTSATSANASIRLQGLDGKYTQLLKDGFANFGNFSGGLSVLEIPPLDLKQVEIIKGPASTLFGGGAIAGVVNFISKAPKEKPAYNLIINRSNIGQTNIGGFASAKGKKIGYTLLALYNKQKAYDVDKDDFTEVPVSDEVTVHPKIFIYPGEKTTVIIGNSFTAAKRTGGDIYAVKGIITNDHRYFEKNKTTRNISTFELENKISTGKTITAKQSFSIFDRGIHIPSYSFGGKEYSAYTDVAFSTNKGRHNMVTGLNLLYNHFREDNAARNYTGRTAGVYAQHTWDANEKMKLESGLRIDAANYKNGLYSKTEVFVLPRASLLVKYNSKFSSRVSAGMGYKSPTLFTEETERIQYKDVLQLQGLHSEKSYGATADVNYRERIGSELSFSLNHMLFYTLIGRPLVLNDNGSAFYFSNAGKSLYSLGFETNAKFIYKEYFKLFLGYTFTHSKAGFLTGNQYLPLVPKGKLNTALIYEKEAAFKIGLEAYFTGRQYLSNGNRTPAYSEFGLMAEKIFKRFSLYINFENISDTRQSRYKNVVNGSHLAPSFDEIWTHTEGFTFNGGIKLKF